MMHNKVRTNSNIKTIILGIISTLLIAYFTLLSYRQLLYATPVYDNDYKTFYVSLRDPMTVYDDHFYMRVYGYFKEKGDQKIQAKTSPTLTAVNMNTPLMCLFLRGLVNVSHSLNINSLVFAVCSLFCGFAGFVFLMRIFDEVNPWYVPALFLLLYFSWPSFSALKLGQVSYLVLPFLSLGFLSVYRKQYTASAVILGFVAALKLFFLIFLVFYLIRMDWKRAIIFLSTFLIFFFLPVLYFHWPVYDSFYKLTQNHFIFISHATFSMNGSLLGVIVRTESLFDLPFTNTQTNLLLLLLSLYFLVRYVIYDFKVVSALPEFSDALRISFLIVLAIMLSPLGWVYYFIFMTVPVFVFFKISEQYALTRTFFVFLSLSFVLPYIAWLQPTTHMMWFCVGSMPFLSLLCWMVCLCSATNSVRYQRLHSEDRRSVFFAVLFIQVLASIVLLYANFGMPYFLDLFKKEYVANTMSAISLPPKHPL